MGSPIRCEDCATYDPCAEYRSQAGHQAHQGPWSSCGSWGFEVRRLRQRDGSWAWPYRHRPYSHHDLDQKRFSNSSWKGEHKGNHRRGSRDQGQRQIHGAWNCRGGEKGLLLSTRHKGFGRFEPVVCIDTISVTEFGFHMHDCLTLTRWACSSQKPECLGFPDFSTQVGCTLILPRFHALFAQDLRPWLFFGRRPKSPFPTS